MKTLSLKLDDNIFEDTEKVVAELKLARNRYINDALKFYNTFNKRKILKKKLIKESLLVTQSSSEVLVEFEKLVDELQTVRYLAGRFKPNHWHRTRQNKTSSKYSNRFT